MNRKIYLVVSGTTFALIAVLHVLRVVNSWHVVIDSWTLPMPFSWVAVILAGGLSIWASQMALKE